jgi:imidazole glycerol-phosphate synthase subunit HisF
MVSIIIPNYIMLANRIIPCLDIDAGRVVKGTEFVDIRDVGNPVELAEQYEAEGADEIVYLDITATAGQRGPMVGLVRDTVSKLGIPLTVGGGIRSVFDVQALLDAGADKTAINSAALREPQLLNEVSDRFGSQCTVLAVDVKRDDTGGWEVYAAGGREATGRQAIAWIREAVARGAGEVLLTSMNQDGTNTGYDLPLIEVLTDELSVPVIASGGAGQLEHFGEAIQAGADAVLAASKFHSGSISIGGVKEYLDSIGIPVRPVSSATPFVPRNEQLGSRPNIAIVDYGMGNRYSVQKALERAGADSVITGDFDELSDASGVVLPGVGAFQPAMERLREAGLDHAIRRLANLGKPILGICLGEQLLFDGSEEGEPYPGLGLIPGIIQEIELPTKPNIGWRTVGFTQTDPLLVGLPDNDYFYHLHQYAARPIDTTTTLASSQLPYAANPAYQAVSIVRHGSVYGTQFHPEKSSVAGQRLLRNFVDLC